MLQECLRNNQHAHYTRKCLAGQVSKTASHVQMSMQEDGVCVDVLLVFSSLSFFLALLALKALCIIVLTIHVYDPMHLYFTLHFLLKI